MVGLDLVLPLFHEHLLALLDQVVHPVNLFHHSALFIREVVQAALHFNNILVYCLQTVFCSEEIRLDPHVCIGISKLLH